nr:ribonuclease H-like domain-containing protein [Tanacetum cinerariifolium]
MKTNNPSPSVEKGILNEHQLKFNSIKDAKQLLEAVKKRIGGNAATKKSQMNLLKQQYENFTTPSSKMLIKLLIGFKSLNKVDLDTMSMDDLYNNLKVYEPKVKGMSNSSSSIQNMDFTSSSTNNTNRAVNTAQAVNTAHEVSTASTQVNAAYSTNIDNLSDVVICSFFASQPNSPQLVHEDLKQIYPDDMEEMDLRWQMAMLTMRARRFLKKTRRKLTINGNKTIGFEGGDILLGSTELQEIKTTSTKKAKKRSMPVETSTSTTLMPCDGLGGYNWSDQAEEGSNYALMAFSSSSSGSEVDCNYHQKQFQNQRMVKPIWNNAQRVNHRNFAKKTHPCAKKNMVPRAVLMKSGLVSINTARQNISKAAALVNTAGQVNVAHSKTTVNAARSMSYLSKTTSTVRGPFIGTQHLKTVIGNPQMDLHDQGVIDSDHLGKFDGKADEGFFVGFLNSKAFRVFNSRTRIVEENFHIRFSKSIPNVVGSALDWLFDIDALIRTINYEPIVVGTQSNGFAGTKANDNIGKAKKETKSVKYYILLPLWTVDPPFSQDPKSCHDDGSKPSSDDRKKVDEDLRKKVNVMIKRRKIMLTSLTILIRKLLFDPNMHALEDVSIFNFSCDDEDDGAMADMNNLDTTIQVSPTPTTIIHKDHPLDCDWRFAFCYTNKKDVKEFRGTWIWIDYDEVFALVVRIEAIRLLLAYASFKDFMVYQMDVKSAFLYRKIEEKVYVCQPLGFEDLDFPDRVYNVEKALYGLHQAPRDCTPMETQKPLLKDEDGKEVDVHMYTSMIGSLMYLTSSRPDIMFALCAYARY